MAGMSRTRWSLVGVTLGFTLVLVGCGDDAHDPFFEVVSNPRQKFGEITVDTGTANGTPSAAASFYTDAGDGVSRTTTVAGGCMAEVLVFSRVIPALSVWPGAVAISSARGLARLTADAPGSPTFALDDPSAFAADWRAGDQLSLQAGGGDIPDVTATATVPADVTIDLPAEGATIDRTVDLTLSWTSDTSAQPVAFFVTAYDAQEAGLDGRMTLPRTVIIKCHSAPGDTSLVIPHELLAKLADLADAQGISHLSLWGARVHETRSWAGDFLITFEVRSGLRWTNLLAR